MIDFFRGGIMEQSTRDVAEITQSNEEEQILAIPAARRDLTLVSAAHAVIHAVAVLMPLIYPFIQKEYDLSYVQIGLIVAIPNAVGGFLQLVFLIAEPLHFAKGHVRRWQHCGWGEHVHDRYDNRLLVIDVVELIFAHCRSAAASCWQFLPV
jgi:hypothetical protein